MSLFSVNRHTIISYPLAEIHTSTLWCSVLCGPVSPTDIIPKDSPSPPFEEKKQISHKTLAGDKNLSTLAGKGGRRKAAYATGLCTEKDTFPGPPPKISLKRTKWGRYFSQCIWLVVYGSIPHGNYLLGYLKFSLSKNRGRSCEGGRGQGCTIILLDDNLRHGFKLVA